MKEEITINLRALDPISMAEIHKILFEQNKLVPDETNEEALEIIRNFKEEDL